MGGDERHDARSHVGHLRHSNAGRPRPPTRRATTLRRAPAPRIITAEWTRPRTTTRFSPEATEENTTMAPTPRTVTTAVTTVGEAVSWTAYAARVSNWS